MAERKRGPFTIAEFQRFWETTLVDPEYARPLVAAGEGEGLEVFTQQMAQLARASEAVERTLEAMFILPFSGQTDEPAAGGAKATVTLTFTRTERFEREVTLSADTIVEEVTTDSAPNEGIEVRTGRRYKLQTTITFEPGDRGPLTVTAVAENDGYGYNNPLPGTLKSIVQPGAEFKNSAGKIVTGQFTHRLLGDPSPDVFVPEHIGQYIEILSGANTGEFRLIVGFEEADSTVPHGGVAILSKTLVGRITVVTSPFIDGEDIVSLTSGGIGRLVHTSADYIVLDRVDGTFAAADTLEGAASNATVTLDTITKTGDMVDEPVPVTDPGVVSWRIVNWGGDLGVVVTNVSSPSGGKTAMLDALGDERSIQRASGESDDDYRKRVATLPDIVSPNAIRRVVNRILVPLGFEACFREVGDIDDLFPGMFYDQSDSFFDFDFVARPQDRFRLVMDFTEMRAFFLIGVPPLNFGEFGFGYDEGGIPAFDAFPRLAFYDGFPLTAAVIYRSIFQAVDQIRAGGAGFDLYVENLGCF